MFISHDEELKNIFFFSFLLKTQELANFLFVLDKSVSIITWQIKNKSKKKLSLFNQHTYHLQCISDQGELPRVGSDMPVFVYSMWKSDALKVTRNIPVFLYSMWKSGALRATRNICRSLMDMLIEWSKRLYFRKITLYILFLSRIQACSFSPMID